MNDKIRTFTKPWALCVGSDRVSTMLRAEYWERFETLKAVMPVQYIRCHGLLCDELGVVRRRERNGADVILYNFTYLDQAFDAMRAHGVRPYVEWGFMPTDLASGDQTIFWWKGNVTPPKDWNEWANLVVALTQHWIDRYGAEEVRQWPFEVWNEPNLTNFWKDADQDAYFHMYEVTVTAIKSVDPLIKVGGPAICGGQDHWIDDFLAFVLKRRLPLDIFTRHLYTGEPPKKQTEDIFYQALAEPRKPIDELREVRARIDGNGFAAVPLHITEFNTSYNPVCPVHDTPYNAAYLASLLAEAGEHADLMSFWTFSDLFEEQDVPRALFHGGFGMIGRHGILKPTYHAFAFFSRMGSEIVHQDERCLATRRADGVICAVAWNPCREVGASDDRRVASVSIPWKGSSALALRVRVNETLGNPWEAWRAMGRPLNPSPAQIEFLKIAAAPGAEQAVIEPENGTLALRVTLERNEITLIELTPFKDESAGYPGLEDSLIDGYADEPVRRPSFL